MKFIDKLFHDKKFRGKVAFFILLFFVVYSFSLNDDKKSTSSKEVCTQYNLCTIYNTPSESYNPDNYLCITSVSRILEHGEDECIAVGCNVQYNKSPFGSVNDYGPRCVAEATTGKYTISSSKAEASLQCESGESSDMIDDNILGEQLYKCIQADPGETCNGKEKIIGDLVRSLGLDVGCKSAYQIGIFGGGFLAFVMILAVL